MGETSVMKTMRWGGLGIIFALLFATFGQHVTNATVEPISSQQYAQSANEVISAENANQVALLSQIGLGRFEDATINSDGTTLVFTTSEGTWLYDLTSSTQTPFSSETIELPLFSPDGSLLAGINGDQIVFWSLDGEVLQTISNGYLRAERLAFSPDSSVVVAYQMLDQDAHNVTAWSVDGGEILFSSADATTFAISPDSQSVAVGLVDGTLNRFDVGSDTPVQLRQGDGSPLGTISFSPNGSSLLLAGGNAWIVDAETGATLQTFETREESAATATFSPDGQRIETSYAARNRWSQIWDVETGEELQFIGDRVAYFLPDSQTVVTESRTGEMDIRDVETGEILRESHEVAARISHRFVMPDGVSLIVISPFTGIWQWDLETGDVQRRLDGFYFANAKFVPDGHQLLRWWVGIPNESISMWDIPTGEISQTFNADALLAGELTIGLSNDFSSDGRWFAASDFDGMVYVWDVETGERLHQLNPEMGRIQHVAFSPDDSRLAAVYRTQGVVWDVETGEVLDEYGDAITKQVGIQTMNSGVAAQLIFLNNDQLEIWSGNSSTPLQTTYTGELNTFFDSGLSTYYIVAPDGRTVATNDAYNWRIWDAETGETLQVIDDYEHLPHFGISFSYDSRYLMLNMANEDQVVVIDVETGETVQIFELESVTSAAWSSVNHVMVVANDEMVFLYNSVTGEELWSIDLPKGRARQISFSPTGEYFITQGHAFLYNQNPGAVHVFGIPSD